MPDRARSQRREGGIHLLRIQGRIQEFNKGGARMGNIEIYKLMYLPERASRANFKRRGREATILEIKKLLTTRGYGPYGGSVISSPAGSGQSHGNRRDFEYFMQKWSTFWDLLNLF